MLAGIEIEKNTQTHICDEKREEENAMPPSQRKSKDVESGSIPKHRNEDNSLYKDTLIKKNTHTKAKDEKIEIK